MPDETVLEDQLEATGDEAAAELPAEEEAPAEAPDESAEEPAAPAEPVVGENHASLDAALAAQQGQVKPAATAPEPGTPGFFTGAAPPSPPAPWAAAIGTDQHRDTWPGTPAPPAPAPEPEP